MHLIQTFRVNTHWVHTDANCLLTMNSVFFFFFYFCSVLCICFLYVLLCLLISLQSSENTQLLLSSLASSFSDTGVCFSVSPLSSLLSVWQAVLSVTDLFCLCTSLPNLFYETLHLSQALPLPWREKGEEHKKTGGERAKSSVRMVAKWSGCTLFPSLFSSYITVITLPKPLLETS